MSKVDPNNFEKTNPQFIDLRRRAFRNTAKILGDLPSFTVFQVIADRSFDWGWEGEVILGKHFHEGVYGKGGQEWFSGLPLSRASIYTAIGKLKKLGAITVKKVRNLTYYAINLEWLMSIPTVKQGKARNNVPASVDRSEFTGDDFDTHRAPETVQEMDTPPVKRSKAVQEVDTEERTSSFRTISEETTCEAGASLCGPLADCVERKQTKTEAGAAAANPKVEAMRAKRNARAAEHNGRDLFEAFAAAARETWAEAGPLPLPTGKDVGRLRNHSRAWTHEGVTYLGFVEWCAVNWRGVWESKMSHVPDPKVKELFSEYPSIESFLIYQRAFRDSYDRRDTQAIRAGLTRRDRLIRSYLFKGWSQEHAERDADEVIAREKKREDLDMRAQEVNAAARRLQAREQDIDNRIALGKARIALWEARPVKPVSLKHPSLKGVIIREIEDFPPLRPFPEWRDDPEEACAA